MNEPPQGGGLSVSPSSGTEMNTTFYLSTSAWLDDDLPFSYQFVYYAAGPGVGPDVSAVGGYVVIKDDTFVSSQSALLRRGAPALDFVGTCQARVSDVFGSVGAAETTVTVRARQAIDDGLIDVVIGLTTGLATSIKDNDMDALFQLIAGYSAILSDVNCSAAPDCTELNRSPCGGVAGTCGACLTLYPVGESGAANSACYSKNDTSGDDGLSYISLSSEDKKCPNDCSSAGVCTAYSADGGEVASCSAGDALCRVRCDCNEGAFGSVCSLDAAALSLVLVAREVGGL
jgi:hypothetical protein